VANNENVSEATMSPPVSIMHLATPAPQLFSPVSVLIADRASFSSAYKRHAQMFLPRLSPHLFVFFLGSGLFPWIVDFHPGPSFLWDSRGLEIKLWSGIPSACLMQLNSLSSFHCFLWEVLSLFHAFFSPCPKKRPLGALKTSRSFVWDG